MDVWALGVTFFKLASGRLPFDISAAPGTMVKPPHLDRGSQFNHLLAAVLRYKPADRATAADVLQMPFINRPAEMRSRSMPWYWIAPVGSRDSFQASQTSSAMGLVRSLQISFGSQARPYPNATGSLPSKLASREDPGRRPESTDCNTQAFAVIEETKGHL